MVALTIFINIASEGGKKSVMTVLMIITLTTTWDGASIAHGNNEKYVCQWFFRGRIVESIATTTLDIP